MTKLFNSPKTEHLKDTNSLHKSKIPRNTPTILAYLNWFDTETDLGEQTDSLIMDTFIQNMNNKTVHQKLCIEPKNDPQEASRYAIADEDGINQHRTLEGGNVMKENKNELVCAVDERRNPCSRCGLEFSQNHLAVCEAKDERCKNCSLFCYFARM